MAHSAPSSIPPDTSAAAAVIILPPFSFPFADFPSLHATICPFLTISDILQLSKVNRYLHRTVNHDNVWRPLVQAWFGKMDLTSIDPANTSQKQLFRACFELPCMYDGVDDPCTPFFTKSSLSNIWAKNWASLWLICKYCGQKMCRQHKCPCHCLDNRCNRKAESTPIRSCMNCKGWLHDGDQDDCFADMFFCELCEMDLCRFCATSRHCDLCGESSCGDCFEGQDCCECGLWFHRDCTRFHGAVCGRCFDDNSGNFCFICGTSIMFHQSRVCRHCCATICDNCNLENSCENCGTSGNWARS